MKCDGHAKITDAAIELLLKNCAHDPAIKQEHCNANFFVTDENNFTDPENSVASDNTSTAIRSAIYGNAKSESTGPLALLLVFLSPQNYREGAVWQPHKGFLSHRVVAIDLDRIYLAAHFPKYFKDLQKIHFMREINQKNFAANKACTEHIKLNLDKWISGAIRYFKNRGLYTDWSNLKAAIEPLALALHALQDSFSPGHVERIPATGISSAGAIKNIHTYDDDNKIDHAHHDYQSGALNSEYGRLAVQASAEMMLQSLRSISKGSPVFTDWEIFKDKWLQLAPSARMN